MNITNKNICSKFLYTSICLIISLLLVFSNVLFFCTFNSQKAFAYQTVKTFSWKTNIDAQISTSGAIQVAEQRIIDITKFIEKAKNNNPKIRETPNLNPSLSPLVWNFNNFPEETEVVVSDAKIAILSNEDTVIGKWSNIAPGVFQDRWHGDYGPNKAMYTYSKDMEQMCLFTELTNPDQYSSKQAFDIMTQMTGISDPSKWICTKAIINLNYNINRAAYIYKDVCDFQWIYSTDTWAMDSFDVNVNISIPVGTESIANPLGKVTSLEPNKESTTERNIYAWGHGSSTGIVNLDPSGRLNLKNEIVPGGSDAEVRIAFPRAWLTNLDPKSNTTQINQSKLTTILKEESVWHDYRTDAVNKMLLPLFFIPICIILVFLVLIVNIIYKRRFLIKNIQIKNIEELHPCLLFRLKNWNHERVHDLIISILYLYEQKRISINRQASGDYEIKLKNANLAQNPYNAKNLNIIDVRTINFLFTEIACKNATIKLEDIINYARARSYDFVSKYLTWHSLLTDEVNQFANFKSSHDKIRHACFAISIFILIVSLALGIFFVEFITPIVGVISAITIAAASNCMRNKVYFKNSNRKKIDAIDVNIGLAQHNKNIQQFETTADKKILKAVLNAQDIISKWNLENIDTSS